MPHTRQEILDIGREVASKVFGGKDEKVWPDKLYVPMKLGSPDYLATSPKQDVYHDCEEYIRKNILLDRLARAKALRERSGSNDTEVFEVLTNLIKEL